MLKKFFRYFAMLLVLLAMFYAYRITYYSLFLLSLLVFGYYFVKYIFAQLLVDPNKEEGEGKQKSSIIEDLKQINKNLQPFSLYLALVLAHFTFRMLLTSIFDKDSYLIYFPFHRFYEFIPYSETIFLDSLLYAVFCFLLVLFFTVVVVAVFSSEARLPAKTPIQLWMKNMSEKNRNK